MLLLKISTPLIITLVFSAILLIAVIVLYFLGKRAEKKQAEQKEMMEETSQTMSFYVIDKKKVRLKEAGLPKIVMEQTPKYLRRAKLPVIKVKVGPKVMSLICEESVFQTILPKQEVKAKVSGIYVTEARRIRGPLPEVKKTKKQLREEKKAEQKKAKEAEQRKEERYQKKQNKKNS